MRQDAMRKHWAAGACLAALLAAGCAPSARVANGPAAPAVPALASPIPPAASPVRSDAPPPPAAPQSGRDVAELELAATRLRAQIDRNISEYQRYPRKKFIGARPGEERFARYEEAWRKKIEDVGNLNYPSEARGRIYGTVLLTVSIRPDGSLESVALDRSSGYRVLDQAAVRIVRLASPFAPFPAEISRDTDLLVITRAWYFGRGDQVAAAKTDAAARPDVPQDWVEAIRAKVRSNLVLPAATPPDIEASFSIVQLPTGELLSVQMLSSSGFKPYDEAARSAISRSSPLPKAPPGLFRRELILTFRP